jgi:hypothetical protein
MDFNPLHHILEGKSPVEFDMSFPGDFPAIFTSLSYGISPCNLHEDSIKSY